MTRVFMRHDSSTGACRLFRPPGTFGDASEPRPTRLTDETFIPSVRARNEKLEEGKIETGELPSRQQERSSPFRGRIFSRLAMHAVLSTNVREYSLSFDKCEAVRTFARSAEDKRFSLFHSLGGGAPLLWGLHLQWMSEKVREIVCPLRYERMFPIKRFAFIDTLLYRFLFVPLCCI